MNKNILILNMTRMGDLIQSTPAISGLRKQNPSARITLLVTSVFAEFSKRIPHIDERVIFDIGQFEGKQQPNGILWIRLYKYIESLLNELKTKKYDLLINLSHSKLSAFMISYLGIKNMRGFGCNGAGDRVTQDPWMQYFGTEPFNRELNPFNLVEIFTRGTGSAPEDNAISIQQDSHDKDSIEEIICQYNIKDEDFLIGFQAGSSIKGRRWPARAFAELADGLIQNHDAKIILLGVTSEKPLAEEIKSYTQSKDNLIDLTGKTNIGQLATLVKSCAYLVTNDTGTMHIAAAVGTPIIGLFFAHAHPFETGPYGPGHLIFQARIPCAPCSYGVECNDIVCVRTVRPDHILSMIKIHQNEGQWLLAESMSGLEEINIYSTYIGEDRRLRLRPLVRHPLGLNDIFREIYADHWLDSLGAVTLNASVNYDIGKIFLEDYDCSDAYSLLNRIREKISALKGIEKLAHRGISAAEEITHLCSGKKATNIIRVRILADTIELLDEEISRVGFTHPELKPVTDMFNKRKENFQGDDPVKLASDTKKCYESILKDSKGMSRRLTLVLKILKLNDSCQAAVSSFNVEVPGK